MAQQKWPDWERVKSLFAAALDQPADQRLAYLTEACQGDLQLLAEVQKLLQAHDDAGSFLQSAELSLKQLFQDEPSDDAMIGRKIGPYYIEQLIGRGGMGQVYLALRKDDIFHKRFALKIVKRGMDSDEILRRFQHERQTLAALEHPYIARLYDGGTTDDGLPYFVMEYVEGLPIDEYCELHRLSIEERLELFCKVCEAVHYAHQNLIIHRDIKPGNILVDENGQPRLLDFGIAKVLHPDPAAQSAGLTREHQFLLTPEYASPEQIAGLPITTASDVYSLGVLLYELLTGRRPYDLKGRSPAEIEKTIRTTEPLRPSQAVLRTAKSDALPNKAPSQPLIARLPGQVPPAARLHRRLKGDLDTIVLMALRKEPQRRYSSAEQFASDIRRHLHGLPIMARRDDAWYKARKFVYRHRRGVATGLLIFILLVASVVMLSIQANMIARERDRARMQAMKARAVNQFLQAMLAAADPLSTRSDITIGQLLENAAEKARIELRDQPDIQAAVYSTIGQIYTNMARFDEADWFLMQAADILMRQPPDHQEDLPTALQSLAVLRRQQGRFLESDSLFRTAIDLFHARADTGSLVYAKTLNDYSILLGQLEKYQQAENYLLTSLQIQQRILGAEHKDLIHPLNNLGSNYLNLGDYAHAEQYYRQALALAEKYDSPTMGILYNNLATLMDLKGDYASGEGFMLRSLDFQKRILGKTHPYVGQAYINLAANAVYQKEYRKALRYVLAGKAIFDQVLSPDHPNRVYLAMWEGRILNRLGRLNEAETLLRNAIRRGRRILPGNHWYVTYCELDLGHNLLLQKRYEEAGRLLQKTYMQLLNTPGDNQSAIRKCLQHWIETQQQLGRISKADSLRALLQTMKP